MNRKHYFRELGNRPFRNFRGGGSAVDKFRMISLGMKFKKQGKGCGKNVRIISGLTIEVCRLNSKFSNCSTESPMLSRPQSTLHQRLNFNIKDPKVNLSSKVLKINNYSRLNLNSKLTRNNLTPKVIKSNTVSPVPTEKKSKKILITKIPQAILYDT